MQLTHTVTVALGKRSYPIVIGSGLLAGGYDLAGRVPERCLIVTNETVAPLYLARFEAMLSGSRSDSLILPDGERWKTLATVEKVLDALVGMRAGRDASIIALGGGVVGDIAGFAAACYMRGIGFIQVPTTLLAQVDSSVGGKTGVNHPRGKNLIGAFHQPSLVLIDTATLATLPDRELRAGIAEIIKYGVIADAEFFAWLEDGMEALLARDAAALAHAIRRSCEIKAEIVSEDERERGRRALLNFGHTFGHAIEAALGYGRWLHGEAVAAGMVMASALSGGDPDEHHRLRRLIERAGLPALPPRIGAEALQRAMELDKKAASGSLRFVLLSALGKAYVTGNYPRERLEAILAGDVDLVS